MAITWFRQQCEREEVKVREVMLVLTLTDVGSLLCLERRVMGTCFVVMM